MRTDAQLLKEVAARDRGALEALYQRYSCDLFAMAKRILGDPALAECAVVELFVELWRQPPPLPKLVPLQALLFANIRARALLMRDGNGQPRVAPRADADDREILELSFFDGWSLGDLAHVCGQTREQLSRRVSRALTSLARSLDGRS